MSSQGNSGGAKTGTTGNRKRPASPSNHPAATQPREKAGENAEAPKSGDAVRDGAAKPAAKPATKPATGPAAEATQPRRRDSVADPGGRPAKAEESKVTTRIRADKPWSSGDDAAPRSATNAGVGLMHGRAPEGARPSGGSVATDSPAARPTPKPSGKGGKSEPRAPRKAHLILRRIEPWSAMKFSFVVALVCFVVLFVAIAVLYGVLSALGVFDSIVQTVTQLTQGDGQQAAGLDIQSWFEPVRILGYTALIGAVNVVLITALATLGTVIYNLSADLVGGIEVTFSEAE